EPLAALAGLGPEVVGVAPRLEGRPGLRGRDEQRALEVEALVRLPDRRRMRRVENLERARLERLREHVRREARAAHAEEDECVDHPGRGHVLDEAQEVLEPAEPLRLVAAGPERRVAGPDPLDQLCGGNRAHPTSSTKPSTSSSNSRGRSMLGTCAASAIVSRRASGISRASRSAIAWMSVTS